MSAEVPPHIVETINTLLAPYGKIYAPSGGVRRGYTNWEGAAKYTCLSKSTLRRAVNTGALAPPHKVGKGLNGAVLFAYEDLDKFVQSAR